RNGRQVQREAGRGDGRRGKEVLRRVQRGGRGHGRLPDGGGPRDARLHRGRGPRGLVRDGDGLGGRPKGRGEGHPDIQGDEGCLLGGRGGPVEAHKLRDPPRRRRAGQGATGARGDLRLRLERDRYRKVRGEEGRPGRRRVGAGGEHSAQGRDLEVASTTAAGNSVGMRRSTLPQW